MKTKTLLLCSLLPLLIAGCSNQTEGQGGFAEHNFSNTPDHRVGLENALYFEQQFNNRHLDSLILAGAKICFPASVTTATIRKARIARELQGGLKADAANDLIIQRDHLARLERRLNYVQLQGSCLTAQLESSKKESSLNIAQMQRIHSLLNNNNQFVTDSVELNPRYLEQLAEVAILLREHPSYQLKITGHSDVTGDPVYNLKLSLQRAKKVERYLQIFGLNPSNIKVIGNGQKTPLFNGNEAQVLLVNRRVSIELSKISHNQEVGSP